MSDYLNSPKFLFGFQVHHLLPVEVFRDEILDELLMRAGVKLDMRGNKIALAADQGLASLFAGQSEAFKNILTAAGWGWNSHFGSHPGYNRFFTVQLREISAAQYNDPETEKRAVFDLIRFARDVSAGRIEGVDIKSGAGSLDAQWGTFKIDPAQTSGADFDKINSYIDGFDLSLVDGLPRHHPFKQTYRRRWRFARGSWRVQCQRQPGGFRRAQGRHSPCARDA